MTSTTLPRPFIQLYDVRWRIWPILLAGLLMEGIRRSGQAAAKWIYLGGPTAWDGHLSIYLLLAIALQAALGLVGIAIMKRLLPEADPHLRWPPHRSCTGAALAIGVGMGIAMLIADYWPALLAGSPPQSSYAATPYGLNTVGYLVGMLTTGLAEETIFRGLLVGFLVILVPGRLRIGKFDLPVAAYIVAFLFGLGHWQSFVVSPLHEAIAQQVYAFAWGLIYVWLMERSRSLLAPIIAHGVGNFTEVSLILLLVAAWS